MDTCKHTRVETVKEPADSMHHKAIRCLDCSKVIKYIPKIANINLRKQYVLLVNALLSTSKTDFDKGYLTCLLDAERPDGIKPSPKQKIRLEAMRNK
jgi:hypothetical protein